MLKFREFLDKPTLSRGSTDPRTMAGNWERLAPQNPVQNQVDINRVWSMVRRMSNNEANRAWVELIERVGTKLPDVTVFKSPLDEMVKVPGIMGVVSGEISQEDPGFYCSPMTKDETGELRGKVANLVRIAPPPLVYTNDDRALLAGIILHELRHAIDFHEMGGTMGSIDYTRDMGTHYEINIDEYARNILECRAHADQVKNLISTLGGGERARRALRETAFSRIFVPELRDSMLELVDLLCSKNENFSPPAIVRTVDRNESERAIDIIENICESFRLERFLKKSHFSP